jgi:acyl-CoA synthetase (AMP-forming)/AMP-acid ligase II
MGCLIEKLMVSQPDDIFWYTTDAKPINASMLVIAMQSIPSEKWQGKRVAIGEMSVLNFLTTLVFLDGLAETILLLPAEDSPHARSARLDAADIDYVLENDSLNFPQLLESLKESVSRKFELSAIVNRPIDIETIWLLPTSGTTGAPKLISHTYSSLTRSMTDRHLGDEYIWGSLYSLRRFAGLQVFLQSWISLTPLVLSNEGTGLTHVLTHLETLGCNALSATPSMWRKLAMNPAFDQLKLKQITLGGEIVDQGVLDMLRKRFPLARITHIYASTETGVGFAVRDGKSGFPSSFLEVAASGVSIRVSDENQLQFLVPREPDIETQAAAQWLDSGDVVQITGNRVHFLGRANGCINVGGSKVMPEEVEAVIKELDEVAFAQVRARKSAMIGNLVEAVITPIAGIAFDATLKKKITTHCQSRLDAFKVPAFIVEAADIALTASGKISRANIQ